MPAVRAGGVRRVLAVALPGVVRIGEGVGRARVDLEVEGLARLLRRGLELLRDDGLRYNPNETLIYRELAWFFQHKMGANLDDGHAYYKRQWLLCPLLLKLLLLVPPALRVQ